MYTIPTFEAIRAAYLRDVKNLLPDAATDADSDHYIRATAEAAAVEGLYQHQLWIARQVLPDTADPEYLERHAALRGISRKPAIPASGDLLVQGTPGAVVPLGESVRHVATGLIFLTTDQAIIGTDGWTVAPVAAAKAGVMPVFSGEPVLFVQAPEGVLSQAGLTLSGGVAAETDAALLARLLDYMQHPPGGGNAYDFKHWALTVAGVSRAWTFPHRRGLGSVDVAVLGPDGPCPPSVLAAAQAMVDEKRPAACMDAWVLSPTPVNVAVKVAVRLDATVTTLALFTAQLQEALGAALAVSLDPLRGLPPLAALEWLEDYERVYGLPGDCRQPGLLLQERLALLAIALPERAAINRAYFIWLAAQLGYVITIEEFGQFKAGFARAGERITNYEALFSAGWRAGWSLAQGAPWQYVWLVHASGEPATLYRAGVSGAGEPLASSTSFWNAPSAPPPRPTPWSTLPTEDSPCTASTAPEP